MQSYYLFQDSMCQVYSVLYNQSKINTASDLYIIPYQGAEGECCTLGDDRTPEYSIGTATGRLGPVIRMW